MKLSEAVKPISYIKAHASEVVKGIGEKGPVVITLNREAKAVLQDIDEYEKTQESLALLKILAQGRKSVQEGKVSPPRKAFARIRKTIEKHDRRR